MKLLAEDRHRQSVRVVARAVLAGCLATVWPLGHASAQLDTFLRGLTGTVLPNVRPPSYQPPPSAYPQPSYPAPSYPPQGYAPPPGYAQYPSSPASRREPEISRTDVIELQRLLNDLGYDAGPPSGAADGRTIDALRRFQRDHGVPASGAVTLASLATVRQAWQGKQARTATSSQATFDCQGSHSRIERMICSSSELSALDGQLGAAYRTTGGVSGPFVADQRRWLALRDECASTACLATLYRKRIAELETAGSGQAAAAPLPTMHDLAAGTATGAAAALPATDATASPGSGDSLAAAGRWNLPVRQGMPALVLGYTGNSTDTVPPNVLAAPYLSWQQPSGQQPSARPVLSPGSMPQQAGWTRAIRAMGLAAEPAAIATLGDVALRNLACNFLSPAQRAAYYGHSALYGSEADVCAAAVLRPGTSDAEVPPGLIPLLQAGGAQFRQEALPGIIQDAPALPMRFVLSWPVSIEGDYDRVRGGYELFSENFNADVGNNTRVFGSPIDVTTPRFWPLPLEAATRFESAHRVGFRGPLRAAVTVTIVGPMTATGGATHDQTGLPEGVMWHFATTPVVLYEDDGLTMRLHDYAPVAPSSGVEAAASGNAVASDAVRNGIDAARRWKLPTLDAIPVVMRRVDGPALTDLRTDGWTPARMAWPLAMRALGLSLAPDAANRLSDQALLQTVIPYMPADRLAAIGPGQRCDIRGTPPGCEFVQHDAAALARSQDLPRLIAAAPKLPMQLTLVIAMRPGTWDAVRGGFPLLDTHPNSGPAFPALFGTALDAPQPDFWPASESEARAFVAQQGPSGHAMFGGVAAALKGLVYLAVPVTITGRHDYPHLTGAGFDAMTGLPPGSAWRFVPGEAVLYADPELKQRLHAYGSPRRLPAPQIGTAEAEQPKPRGPVTLDVYDAHDQDTALLLLLHSGKPADSVNWPVAAAARLDLENGLRRDLDAARNDPWGVFFDRPFNSSGNPVDAGEIEAFRLWTMKRAAALPDTIELRQAIWAAPGPTRLPLFDPAAYRVLMHSAWPMPGSVDPGFRNVAPSLQQRGIATSQMLPIGVQVRAADTTMLTAAPQPETSYVLDLPNGVPQSVTAGSGSDAAASLHVEARIDGVDNLAINPGSKNTTVLLRLQPLQARLDGGNAVIASTSFAPMTWPEPASPTEAKPPTDTRQALADTQQPLKSQPAALAGWKGPPPEARVAAGPYGPDMLGIRLGTTMAEAETLIRAHMQVSAELETETPTGTALLAPVAMLHGKVFIGNDQSDPQNSEQIAIFEVPSFAPGKVAASWRTMYVADGAWDTLSHELADKYGAPQPGLSQPSQMLVWTAGTAEACRLQNVRWPRWAENPAFPGRRLEKVQAFSLPLPSGTQSGALAGCGPMLEVDKGGTDTFAGGSPWFRFTTKLFDPGVLAWLAARYVTDAPALSPAAKVKL